MSSASEAEVRFRIETAFRIAPSMTMGMLQSVLTSRVSSSVRNIILTRMEKEGILKIERMRLPSYRGRSHLVDVVRVVPK